MKVLLINTYQAPESSAGYYRRFLAPMPPITMAYLVAALEQAGVDVDFYDDVLKMGDEAELEAYLKQTKPDVVGISVVTGTMVGGARVSQLVRRVNKDIKVVMGNIHAELFYESIFAAGIADIIVHGEGEITFPELIKELSSTSPSLENVDGISFVRDGEIIRNKERAFIEDLDSLPFPAWHKFPIDKYRIFNFARVKEPGTLILGSRGCPFKCTYCSLIVNGGNRRRRRSAKNIADECEYLYDRFGFLQPSFIDPIFPFYKKEGFEFADEMIKRGLSKKQVWVTETRVDLVDEELLGALYEGGLRRVMFGFESGNADELKAIRKTARIDTAFKAAAACKKTGVQVIGFFILGIKDTTPESMQTTIDFAKALDIDFAKFTIFVPFPGTPEYYELLANGELHEPENWNRYTSYPTVDRPPVYVPKGISVEEIIEYQRKAYLSFYLRPKMIYHQLFKVKTLGFADAVDGLRTFAPAFS